MHSRRDISISLVSIVLAAPFAAEAQQSKGGSPPFVLAVAPGGSRTTVPALRAALSQYVEGQNIVIEERYEDSPNVAAELARRKVDLIFAIGPSAVRASRQATKAVAIVALDFETDPVAEGYIESIARPGSNLTGVFLDQPSLTGKWLQLLMEAVPGLSRVAVLWDPTAGTAQRRVLEELARGLAIELHVFEMRGADLQAALSELSKVRAQALILLSSPLVFRERQLLSDFAARNGLPSVSLFKEFASAGGLMAYGISPAALADRCAAMVDKVLKGHRPGDIPVELPTRFELIINLKTAAILGLTMPPSLLLRADHVIE